MNEQSFTVAQAKARLDYIINIARVDMYKPIHIAEVLYHSRTSDKPLDIQNLESYRNLSLKWRNDVCRRLLGKIPTSSARYQHDVWNDTAMPPYLLKILDQENKSTNGAVEQYIYFKFEERQSTVASVIAYIEQSDTSTFEITELLSMFENKRGIKRSIDKIYEIVAYSLMETVVVALKAEVTVSVPVESKELLSEFSDLAQVLLGLSSGQLSNSVPAHVYRVGVTNASDRGLDMWANFGPAIQVKHLTLDPNLAQNIVHQVESDHVVIVCRDTDFSIIQAFLQQISWGRRVRGIITETQLFNWYIRCLKGKLSGSLAKNLLELLLEEFKQEFPQAAELSEFLQERAYLQITTPSLWQLQIE